MTATKLNDVTVVIIDCMNHALAQRALLDTLAQIAPADIHIWSNQRLLFDSEWFYVSLKNFDDVAQCLWSRVPHEIRTSHYLTIQWDGWVLDGSKWDAEWLKFDYIGAPWPWHRYGRRVGNGGFSLRSKELGQYLARNPTRYPPHHPEDDTLCREYRIQLEDQGFLWASPATASRFSFEREPVSKAFGFHGLFNWPRVLSKDELKARIALSGDYPRSKSEWGEMMAISSMVPA
jgi:hypothetical protein